MQTSNRVFALIPCSLAWPKTLADRGGNGAQLRYIEAFNILRHLNIYHSWPLQARDAELTRRLDPAIIGGVTKGIVTKYLADANVGPGEFCGRLPERNFQDMLENRLPE